MSISLKIQVIPRELLYHAFLSLVVEFCIPCMHFWFVAVTNCSVKVEDYVTNHWCLMLTIVCKKWVGAFKIRVLWSVIGVWWCFYWLFQRGIAGIILIVHISKLSVLHQRWVFLYPFKFLVSVIERRVVCRLVSHLLFQWALISHIWIAESFF